jgi:RNA polymerase sigma-70 factor, ECF subfamily
MTVARTAPIGGQIWGRRPLPTWRHLIALLSRLQDGEREKDQTQHGQSSQRGALDRECEQFIREHERQVLNYLWRMTGEEQAAYDLSQEVFLRAWRHFDTIRRYDRPHSWLYRVATNLALSYIRNRSVRLGALQPEDAGSEPFVADPASQLAESDHVRLTLLRLPAKRRAALVLREVYGFSVGEIAEILRTSDASVRMALSRARLQFRAAYRREGSGHEA